MSVGCVKRVLEQAIIYPRDSGFKQALDIYIFRFGYFSIKDNILYVMPFCLEGQEGSIFMPLIV